jgi:pimeloyl-ACP methyl ester carboxylesterase
MPRIPSGDAQIFYDDLEQGPAVVLIHAFPANHEMWLPAGEVLCTRYRLILPDVRGHGDSQPGNGPATMEKHAADLERICEDAGIKRAVFAGISIGGYMLFEFWRRHKDRVRALILCDTKAAADTDDARKVRLQSADDVLQRGADQFIEGTIVRLLGKTTQTTRPDLVEQVRGMMKKMSTQGIAAVQRGMAERPDSIATLKTIKVPTLILVGEEDNVTTIAEAELMRQHIAGSQLRVIPKGGHYAVFERHETAGHEIRRFLDSVPL